MSRVLLVGFAVIAAVLGYLMDNAWLLSIGGALFVIALLTLVGLSVKRKRRRADAERRRTEELSREDELRSLGISDIRPEARRARRPPSPSKRTAGTWPSPTTSRPSWKPTTKRRTRSP